MDGQTVVITGASRGIGRAVATDLAGDGAHVVICSRDVDALDAVAETIRGDGGTVTTKRADVRDEYDVEHLMEVASTAGDGIDAVVANAGVYHGPTGETPVDAGSYAAFDDHHQTNGRGVFATLREAVPHLNEGARLLVMSGAVARERPAGFGSYAVSKATAEALARGFAADTEYGVAVVDPGIVSTDLSGMDGHDPTDVAPQVRWALTDAPRDQLDGSVLDRKTYRAASN